MALEEITVSSRTETGSGPVGRLRKQGLVPAVIYGHGKPAESLTVDRRSIERIIHAHHSVISVVNDSGGEARRALIREVQYNALTDHVTHVDFLEVSEHEKIQVTVQLTLRGDAKGVKDGGVLQVHMHELEIACPADEVLEDIRIEIDELDLGQIWHVRDLNLPESVEVVSDPDAAVLGCRRPKGTTEDEAAEPAEGAEGEAAPAQPEVISEQKREEREKDKD